MYDILRYNLRIDISKKGSNDLYALVRIIIIHGVNENVEYLQGQLLHARTRDTGPIIGKRTITVKVNENFLFP